MTYITIPMFCTIVTWDCVITFDGEMAFFWKAERRTRLSVARLLFLLNRRLPIIGFSFHVYWRVNRSLDNPLCSIRKLMTYITIPMFCTIESLQMLRVWSLYNRSRSVGFFLLAMAVCGATSSILARTLPMPEGSPWAQLAPERLTGCEYETPKGFFECLTALTLETVLLTMIFLKIRKNGAFIDATRLLRALLMHGAAYYFVLSLAFGLEIFGSMSNELYYPMVDTNFAVCVGVVACNHLMLSLREEAHSPPTSDITDTYTSELHMYPLHQCDT